MNKQEKLFSRRQMLEMAIGLSGLALSGTFGSILAQEMKRTETPAIELGPFYPMMKPLDTDADLTLIDGNKHRAAGQIVHLAGRVLNHRGEPVSGAKLEIWQANTHGRYAHLSDTNPSPLDPNFQGYGVQTTDTEGRYRFKTIKPGAYPISPTAKRTPHIHFDISGRINRVTTQMFFAGEPLNEKDYLYLGLDATDREAAVAKILPTTKEFEPDSMIILYDIVLDKG